MIRNNLLLDEAQRLFDRASAIQGKHRAIDTVLVEVANHFNIPIAAIKGRQRTEKIAFARHVAVALAHELVPGASVADLCKFFGRDHGAIYYAVDKAIAYYGAYPEAKETINNLRRKIQDAQQKTADIPHG